jgi:hypothetical protein
MTILEICTWLEETTLGLTIAESEFIFPTIETLHVLALALVFGSIAMLDLRMLGIANRDRGVAELTADVLPWTWSAFVVAAITGALMFVSSATRYYDNIPFRFKLVLLALAGLNMVVFHLTANRSVHTWNMTLPTPRAAKVAAGLSLFLWIGVIVSGRWIGFV